MKSFRGFNKIKQNLFIGLIALLSASAFAQEADDADDTSSNSRAGSKSDWFSVSAGGGLVFDQFSFVGAEGSVSLPRRLGRYLDASILIKNRSGSFGLIAEFFNTSTEFAGLSDVTPTTIVVARYSALLGMSINPWSSGGLAGLGFGFGYRYWYRIGTAASPAVVNDLQMGGLEAQARFSSLIKGNLGISGQISAFLVHYVLEGGTKSGYSLMSFQVGAKALVSYKFFGWLTASTGAFVRYESVLFSGTGARTVSNGTDGSLPIGIPIEIKIGF